MTVVMVKREVEVVAGFWRNLSLLNDSKMHT